MMQQPDDTLYTVSQLTGSIKSLLEQQFGFITLVGEISNFKRHSSGHLYFTLKDVNSQISAVMFRGNAMSMFFQPADGMEVVVRGNITVYEPRGNYQIIVKEMHPKGEGALRVAFEKLKEKLFEEGLFDSERKKELPLYPKRIAIITSPTGAAIRDMLSVLQERNPSIEVILVPVQVQGREAAPQIAEAIAACNAMKGIDLIITGRGGGSLEDLWAFNEEIVARAIAESVIPVVSAVGHEVDFTISDFAADVRAATPSVAANLVVPHKNELLAGLRDISSTMEKVVSSILEKHWQDVGSYSGAKFFQDPGRLLEPRLQLLDDTHERLNSALRQQMKESHHTIELLASKLAAHDSKKILQKGYAILEKDGTILDSIASVNSEDRLTARLQDGAVESVVTRTIPNDTE